MRRNWRTRRLSPYLAAPVKTGLVVCGPIVLAIVQLANSFFNGLSPSMAIGFAVVMVVFATTAASHHAAVYRLRELERRYGSTS